MLSGVLLGKVKAGLQFREVDREMLQIILSFGDKRTDFNADG